MPAGLRRRTPGLRREEIALLAGVGVSWYTWLEQGREINVSTQVLDALAQTLRAWTAPSAGTHVRMLAEAVPVSVTTKRCQVTEPIMEILDALDPLPAVVTNARSDILARNDAYRDLFRDWHSLPCIHHNTLWCVLTEPTAREKFPQYDEEVLYLVARYRAGLRQARRRQGLGGRHPPPVRPEQRLRRAVGAPRGRRVPVAHLDLHPPGRRPAHLHGQRAPGPRYPRRPHHRLHPGRQRDKKAAAPHP